jgi:hypothetical protein
MVPDAQRALTRKKNAPGKGALQFHQHIAACKPLNTTYSTKAVVYE